MKVLFEFLSSHIQMMITKERKVKQRFKEIPPEPEEEEKKEHYFEEEKKEMWEEIPYQAY